MHWECTGYGAGTSEPGILNWEFTRNTPGIHQEYTGNAPGRGLGILNQESLTGMGRNSPGIHWEFTGNGTENSGPGVLNHESVTGNPSWGIPHQDGQDQTGNLSLGWAGSNQEFTGNEQEFLTEMGKIKLGIHQEFLTGMARISLG